MNHDDLRYIPSPCIRHCTLDDHDVCIGCGRSLDEIKAWTVVTPTEQEAILKSAEQRLKAIRDSRR